MEVAQVLSLDLPVEPSDEEERNKKLLLHHNNFNIIKESRLETL